MAHAGVLLARTLGVAVAADGYSPPYVAAACYASAFYEVPGLLLIHDGLRRFGSFAEPVAAWSVAALRLGTPALYHSSAGRRW